MDIKIKFKGDFKKLIPMGFDFNKLYARNYKVYHKEGVWIWVADGGYVEIKDFFHWSGHIAKAILDGTFPLYEQDTDYKVIFFKKGEAKDCMIDLETGEILPRREFFKKMGWDTFHNFDEGRYRSVHPSMQTMEVIREIKDMIEIEIS
jgi:hypothetical protein